MKRKAPEPVNSLQQISERKDSSPAKRRRFEIVCTICQERLIESDIPWKTLPCGHMFHLNCSEQWLRRKALCPNCRLEISVDGPLIQSSSSESSDSESSDNSDHAIRTNRQLLISGEMKVEDSDSDWDSDSDYRSPPIKADGDTVLTIGRHAMKSYAVIVVEDPRYCDWVMSADTAYGALKAFQNYLLDVRKSGQIWRSRPVMEEKSEWSFSSSSSWVENSEEEILVGFGRYAELTYGELEELHPQYCSWVMRLTNTSGKMKVLQRYLRMRHPSHEV